MDEINKPSSFELILWSSKNFLIGKSNVKKENKKNSLPIIFSVERQIEPTYFVCINT
jgi:hypothetical protein